MNKERHYCPACGAGLIAEPIGASLRCKHCHWRLVTLDVWKKLPPFRQGYVLYMQASWPTSELKDAQNPHTEGSAAWTAFQQGEQRAVIDVQDGEE